MQTLGLSDSTTRTESRLKSLFWPSIQTGDDVDYLGMQGFWICIMVAVLSFVLSAFTGHEIIGAVVLLFFFLGGVGVREHSRFAASVVLVLYVVDTIASGPGALRLFIAAVLFSNPSRDVDRFGMESRVGRSHSSTALSRNLERQIRRLHADVAMAQGSVFFLRFLNRFSDA